MPSARSPKPWFVLAPLLMVAGACAAPPAPETPASAAEEPALDEPEPSGGSAFGAGVEAISAQDFEKARGIFEKITLEKPSNAKAHFYLGVARQNLGQADGAIASYEQALQLDPKLTEASVNLTAALLDAGDAARAEPLIERALRSDPGNGGLLYNRALAASMLGKKAEAVDAYREALAADPNNAEIKYGYAEALVVAGSNSQARALLTELGQSDDLAVLASTARLLGRIEEFDGCIQALNKAIEHQPSAELYVARGLCQHGKKDDSAAFKDFQHGIEKDPRYAPAHYYAGMDLKQRGKKAEARAALGRASELAGDSGIGKAAKRALESL